MARIDAINTKRKQERKAQLQQPAGSEKSGLFKRLRHEVGEDNEAVKESALLRKRARLANGGPDAEKQQSTVFKSLFDSAPKKSAATDGVYGKYEGDFMTRSAKFGLQ